MAKKKAGSKKKTTAAKPVRRSGGRTKKTTGKRPIEQYDHSDKKRVNNPPVGLVTPETDPPTETLPPEKAKKTYQYDPQLDPQLQWAGKAERLSFDVPTLSLHVHERIDPKTIIKAVRAKNGSGNGQLPLFGRPEENPPLRDAVDFYRHKQNWTNRLIAGDSLLVMNSLIEKEGLGGQVQMAYIDPPYGIRYGSNFQPFINKRDVKDGKDDDLTLEPETLTAFRDTWELGIHSYLTYLRDRLLLARELLHESGSCFVQISEENVHHVREVLDEVFGSANFISLVCFAKNSGATDLLLPSITDIILWYAKDKSKAKYHQLFHEKTAGTEYASRYTDLEMPNGSRRPLTRDEKSGVVDIPSGSRLYTMQPAISAGFRETTSVPFTLNGKTYDIGKQRNWKTSIEGMNRLATARRLIGLSNMVYYVRYLEDFPAYKINNTWMDTQDRFAKTFVVQTVPRVIERCLLMTTDPGDLVLDPTCGSGTTAYVAEQQGRRWITTDTSRVAIALAKQRLMTATFDYYTLAHPEQGVASGFVYKTVPHVMLKSIANNPEIREGMTRGEIDAAIAKYAPQETLYDQPEVDRKRARITGPFTVEAVPAAAFGQPSVRPIDPIQWERQQSLPGIGDDDRLQPDSSIAREGETLRQREWREELLKTGIRAKGGKSIDFVRVEPLPGTRWLSADAETKEDKPRRVVVSFGPEHAPLEQRQVAKALEEANLLVPKPAMVVFAALQFDPEAAKDIDETNWPGVTLLKAQMNGDLVTEDLKKKRSSNESFWLIGRPDVDVTKIDKGDDKGKYTVSVHGFDYYNPKTGKVDSGTAAHIAMWMLDPDYDGRSLYPRQVFFPMAGLKDGWARLAKNLNAEIDEELIEQYRGTESLPFEAGPNKRVAVKIVDDRGIESLRIVELS